MERQEMIELLKKDMRGEHQAIIQYLMHAYAMGEGEVACEVEAIAREEMRHLDWLADLINELGGDPSMARDEPDLNLGSPAENLAKNVDLEQVAIDQYRAHIDAIDDPHVRRVLARIVHDEMVHKGQFAGLAEHAAQDAAAAEGAAPAEGAPVPARAVDIFNEGIRHEYTVVLQYLFHSFVAEGKELAEELQTAAINEMQHMGWLAEKLASRGVKPNMSHTELFLSRDAAKNLEADIAVEREVTQAYSSQIPQLEDEGMQELVTRIRDHEIYHDAVFSYLLEEVEAAEEATEPCPAPEKPQEPQEAKSPPPMIPSVGSLIGQD